MKGIKRRVLFAGILGMIAVVLWMNALWTTYNLKREYFGVSVRLFEDGVSKKTLEEAFQQTEEDELTCTVAWTRSDENQAAESKLGGKTTLRVIGVYGDMRQVAPMELLSGTIPTEEDETGCLLDAASAQSLFHSIDAIGANVSLEDKQYTVRGIMKTYEPVMMIRDERAKFENMEFSSLNTDGAKQSVETFLYRCGSTGAYAIVQGGLLARITWSLAWLPLWLVLAWFVVRLAKRGWQTRDKAAKSIPYWIVGGVLLAVLCFGLYLTAFWPQSFLPTRWSDFAFWGKWMEACKAEAKTFSLMTQMPKEIELFSAIRRCVAALIISVLSGGWCIAAFTSARWKKLATRSDLENPDSTFDDGRRKKSS